jgi:hypothetical protein
LLDAGRTLYGLGGDVLVSAGIYGQLYGQLSL